MIKLVIFDLDGVLVEARNIHYEALNRALSKFGEEYVISLEEHLSSYDGLPTSKKLAKLSKEKGLPTDIHEKVWQERRYGEYDARHGRHDAPWRRWGRRNAPVWPYVKSLTWKTGKQLVLLFSLALF